MYVRCVHVQSCREHTENKEKKEHVNRNPSSIRVMLCFCFIVGENRAVQHCMVRAKKVTGIHLEKFFPTQCSTIKVFSILINHPGTPHDQKQHRKLKPLRECSVPSLCMLSLNSIPSN